MTEKKIIMPLAATIQEVNQQAKVVKHAIQKNRKSNAEIARLIMDREIEKLFVIGSGDSLFSGMCVKQAFNDFARIPLFFHQAYEYSQYGEIASEKKSAQFIISSSGRESTTRYALARALKTSDVVIGITDVEVDDNPFYTQPEIVLVPGGMKIGWPTQTTTSTIAVLLDLAIQLGRINRHLSEQEAAKLSNALDQIPNHQQAILDANRELMQHLGERFVDANGIYFIGSGPGYGVANIGAAVMAEGPQKIGVPLYVEEFHHSLRLNTIKLGTPIFLVAPNDPAYKRYLDTLEAVMGWGAYLIAIVDQDDEQIGCKANTIVRIPRVPYQVSALLSLMPIHLFSLEITRALVAKGYQRPWITD